MSKLKQDEKEQLDDLYSGIEESPLSMLMRENDQLNRGKKLRGAGGTSGGTWEFLVGLAMTIGGGYLVTQQVDVTSGYWGFFGRYTSGLTLLPLLIGIGVLFFNGKSLLGKLLTFGGALIIILGIILNLHIYFVTTSLFDTLLMFILLAGGLGLIARSLRPHD